MKIPDIDLGLLVFSICAYSGVSLTVVYFNWWFFTSGFKYPVFISWIQQIVGFGIFYTGSHVARLFSSLRPVFPPARFQPAVIVKCLGMSTSFVLTIGLSNICLQKTLISTYQVARSLTLLFVIALSYLLLKEKQSLPILLSCLTLMTGFVIGSLDPSTLSFGGLMAGSLSSFFQALYNVLIKYTLPHVEGDNQLLLFYNVLMSSFLFFPMVIVCEGLAPFREAFGYDLKNSSYFMIWGGMALSGLLGTTLNMTQYLLIRTTTPLTFNIIGFCKALVQSLGGIVVFGDRVTIESVSGLAISSIGSGLYTFCKHRAMQNRQEAEADMVQSIGVEEKEGGTEWASDTHDVVIIFDDAGIEMDAVPKNLHDKRGATADDLSETETISPSSPGMEPMKVLI